MARRLTLGATLQAVTIAAVFGWRMAEPARCGQQQPTNAHVFADEVGRGEQVKR